MVDYDSIMAILKPESGKWKLTFYNLVESAHSFWTEWRAGDTRQQPDPQPACTLTSRQGNPSGNGKSLELLSSTSKGEPGGSFPAFGFRGRSDGLRYGLPLKRLNSPCWIFFPLGEFSLGVGSHLKRQNQDTSRVRSSHAITKFSMIVIFI